MSGNKGGTAACGSKKPTSAKGSRPERQGKKKRLLNMKEKGEVLDKLDAGMGPVAAASSLLSPPFCFIILPPRHCHIIITLAAILFRNSANLSVY